MTRQPCTDELLSPRRTAERLRILILEVLLLSLLSAALHGAPPVDDYYLIAVGTNPTDTIGAADDPASGAASCTLRDALDIVSAGTVAGPLTGCDITLVGAAPVNPIYVIRLPTGGYTYTIGDMFAGDLDISFHTVHVLGDTPANTIVQAFATPDTANSSLRVFNMFGADVWLYDMTIRHGVFSTPFLGDGAGIHASATDLTLDNVVVRANSARGRGAGIYYQSNNSTPSALQLVNGSTLEDNAGTVGSISPHGAGLYFRGGLVASTLSIHDSTVRNNSSEGDGAGVYLTGATVTAQIVGSLIQGNTATDNNSDGAGLVNTQSSTLIVDASTLEGNQITAGVSGRGGAIFNDSGGNVTLRNGSVIQNNSAPNGGGLYNATFLAPVVTVLDVDFLTNTAQREGGAIYNQSVANVGTDTLAPRFEGNQTSSFSGGAILNTGPTAQLAVSNTTFSGNSATLSGRGGAIENVFGANAVVSDSVFDGNTAALQGGALSNLGAGSSATIRDCGFHNNSAQTGGAIHGGLESTTLLQGTTTVGSVAEPNLALGFGGGISIVDGGTTLTAEGTSIVGNTANLLGGGLFVSAGQIHLVNAVLNENESLGASGGGGGYITGTGALDAEGTDISYNRASAPNGLGGGIAVNYFASGSPSLSLSSGSQLIGNTAGGSGGGIGVRLFGGTLGDVCTIDIDDSVIVGNGAVADGGGIYIGHNSFSVTTDVDLTNVTIADNSATHGGGVAVRHDNSPGVDLLADGVSIVGNVASADGGGVWLSGYGTPVLNFVATAFDDNRATAGSGGGLFIGGESLADLNVLLGNGSRLRRNQAGAHGGAVYLHAEVTFGSVVGAAALQASGVLFDFNTAGAAGGGIYQSQSGVSVTSSVITGSQFLYNTATDNGGAAFVAGGTMTATNSLYAYNEATDGGAFHHQDDVLSVTGSCIAANSPTAVTTLNATPQTFTGNWWGSSDGPGPIGPGQGDTVSDRIDYGGFLTTPPDGLNCPTTNVQTLAIPTASGWALSALALFLVAGGVLILRRGSPG